MRRLLPLAATVAFAAALAIIAVSARAQTVMPAIQGGGGFTKTAADALYCALAGCTMTGGAVYSNVTNDVSSTGNEDLTLNAAGTGAVVVAAAGTASARFVMAGNSFTLRSGANGSAMAFTSGGSPQLGINTAATATSNLYCVSSGIGGSQVNHLCAYSGGRQQLFNGLATCADNANGSTAGTLTYDVQNALVNIINNDPQGCAITLSKTSKVDNTETLFVVTSTAGGVVTLPNVASTHAGPGCATTSGLGINDTYRVHFNGTANQYVGLGCTDN